MRAYTFTNYAGRFLYVEAHNKAHTDTSGPAMSMSFAGADGVFRNSVSMSNSSISPDGGDAGIGGNKIVDGDAASNRYMYHRGLVALRGDDANPALLPTSSIAVRVADAAGNNDTSSVVEWAGEGLPPRVANFQKDFITKYMDPTETYARMDSLTAQFPDLVQAIDLPNKTDGYQRPGMAMMAGTTNPNANPNAANTPFAVQLFSKAQGHLGGNNITAEFKAPAAGTLNAPLSITVTDGTWRDPRSRRHGRQQRHQRDHDPDQGHRGQPRHRRRRRAVQHGGAGDRRDHRRPGGERARQRVHLRRQRGRGHRPGDAEPDLHDP